MTDVLGTVIIVVALLAAGYALVAVLRNRAMDLGHLIGLGVLEALLIAQVVVGFVKLGGGEGPDGTATFVTIRNSGFQGDADQQVKTAVDSTDGFSLVLSGAKAWLENGITLGLIADRHPAGAPAT